MDLTSAAAYDHLHEREKCDLRLIDARPQVFMHTADLSKLWVRIRDWMVDSYL
jgi:hypothetical protein